MKELSVFIDESGDFGESKDNSAYYLVTFKEYLQLILIIIIILLFILQMDYFYCLKMKKCLKLGYCFVLVKNI